MSRPNLQELVTIAVPQMAGVEWIPLVSPDFSSPLRGVIASTVDGRMCTAPVEVSGLEAIRSNGRVQTMLYEKLRSATFWLNHSRNIAWSETP
jgi:hypothetical protein